MSTPNKDHWEALRPLLDAALELAPDARAAWLAEQRKSQPFLVAEVEDLLSHESTIEREGFLAPGHRPNLPAGTTTLEGQDLGAYRIERHLGQGGMGSVWLARRTDGRYEGFAAIKFLSLAVAGPAGEARFRREGSALARLSHPNISRLLDAGVSEAGQPYLVLEFVDGQPLDAWCDQRKLSAEARLRVFLQVLTAVAHAHANLVVHRDLKPSNILVTDDGTVKLLDFGIAKLLEDEQNQGSATASQERVLTFEYASPEQIRGEPISTATDVYSLGVVLFQLLSGRHPTNSACRTPADQIRAVLDSSPSRLSQALTPSASLSADRAQALATARDSSPMKLRRSYRGDLENILGKALRKEPTQRYQAVGAFGEDLARYLRHEPVAAQADRWGYRARKFVRRNRGAVASAVMVALALIGAAIVTTLQAREARRQRDAAVYEKRRADAQIEFQALMTSEVGDKPITMHDILDKGRALLEQENAGDPRFVSAILLQLSSGYATLGDSKTQARLLARAESLAVSGRGADQLAPIRCHMVDNLRSQGSYDEAKRLQQRADSLLLTHPDPDAQITCLQTKSDLETEAGNKDTAAAAARRALDIMERQGASNTLAYFDMMSALAGALHSGGHWRGAREVYAHALAAMESSGRGGMISRLVIQHNLALLLVDLGETADAEKMLSDVVARSARADPNGEVHMQPLIHYAETALYQRHADTAAKYFGALIARALKDTSEYWEGRGTFGLARSEIQLGRLADARRTTERFRTLLAKLPRIKSTDDQIPDGRLLDGALAWASGEKVAAYKALKDALEGNGYAPDQHRKRLRPAVIQTAEAALALGKADEALSLARDARATATLDSLAETRSAFVGEARLLEGRALLAKGDTAGARTALQAAVVALKFGAGPSHPRTSEALDLLASLTKQ